MFWGFLIKWEIVSYSTKSNVLWLLFTSKISFYDQLVYFLSFLFFWFIFFILFYQIKLEFKRFLNKVLKTCVHSWIMSDWYTLFPVHFVLDLKFWQWIHVSYSLYCVLIKCILYIDSQLFDIGLITHRHFVCFISIQPNHATLTNKDGVVTLSPATGSRVLVNGTVLKQDSILHHNDRLVLSLYQGLLSWGSLNSQVCT